MVKRYREGTVMWGNPDGGYVTYEDYDALRDTLTFILTCDHDQLLTEGMDRVRAALKLADGE